MSNFNLKMNLKKLNQVGVAKIKGNSGYKDCVVIPIDENGIFVSDKGGIWFNCRMIAHKDNNGNESIDQYGNTHFISLSLPNKNLEGMSDDEKRTKQPIFGNAEVPGNKDESAREYKVVNVESLDYIPF